VDREDTLDQVRWVIDFHKSGQRTLTGDAEAITRLSPKEADREELKLIVKEAIAEELSVEEVPLGDRWIGGQLILKPGSEKLQERVIPIETFFHKIVMLRDRLRVMEQKINTHPKLSDEDKVDLQQYITRIYGTLTTYNLLFKSRSDHFVGEKGKD
jgi:hypothetical protein